MEAAYVNLASAMQKSTSSDSAMGYDASATSVSMTATTDTLEKHALGSSRQFVGFSRKINEPIIHQICEHASELFPLLQEYSLKDSSKNQAVTVRLRPYSTSPLPGLSKKCNCCWS